MCGQRTHSRMNNQRQTHRDESEESLKCEYSMTKGPSINWHWLALFFHLYFSPSRGFTQMAYFGTNDSTWSTWQLLHHCLCSSVIICEPMRCAVIVCRGPKGIGMEARPQGRAMTGGVGWSGAQGRANHLLMGNTLFSLVWIALSTTAGRGGGLPGGDWHPEARHNF